VNYKALGALLRGVRPNPLKPALPAEPAADDDAVRYATDAAPIPPRAVIDSQPTPEAPIAPRGRATSRAGRSGR